MVDNNYSVIKPVESLGHIGDLTSAKRRQQKKKQNPNKHEDKHDSDENEQSASIEEDIKSQFTEFNQDENSIDYRA